MIRSLLIASLMAGLAGVPASALESADRILEAPGHGAVRALVIGIDHYHHVNQLRGAVADARDIETSLRTMGAADVTALIDDGVDRASVLHALDDLVARTQSGDLVVITLAGHGAKEDERVKGSSPDQSDEVFLLTGFDPKSGPDGTQKILNHEFHHYIAELEQRNAQVLFVADTCYGGGLARNIAFGSTVTYRQVPRYRLVEDDLKPVSTTADAFATPLDFNRTTFLAAVDDQTKAPEVMIDGAYRGALSYAVARAIEGAADDRRDGNITMRELFTYARKVVYQLSDERQNIVTLQSPKRDIDRDVVMQLGTRGVSTISPISLQTGSSLPLPEVAKPLKLASLTGRVDLFANLHPLLTQFEVVDQDATPDVLYDPVSHQAVVGNDTVAYDVGLDDLPGVIDRTAAIRNIMAEVVKSPQAVTVLPDASLHREGERIEVAVNEAMGRNLILVDIAGNGTVEMLFPLHGIPHPLQSPSYSVPFQVQTPYGDDAVVAITSTQPMPDLVAALATLDNRRSAGRLPEVIAHFKPADARIGLVGLFTVP